ncbi:uncharacterized protein FIESC28_08392 [Fusarium coffeatum]|uniref:Uncharacterized protein n=1 Tax=Fusarium coffeatum TaxID=231269 RepID=A0A366R6W2_9HYPO|nr:uncharacterized protein FIESC28_08392 [Fusarium coffeatum]RBR12901.1 hypothetical protein FIESC28_08392 [Fusarium coffeatum]
MVRGIVTSDDSAKGDSPRLDGDTPASSPPEKPIPYKNNIYQQVHASLATRLNEPKGDCPSTLRARLRDDIPATSPPNKPIPHKNNICQQVHASLGINSNFRDRLRDDTPAKSPSNEPIPDKNNIYQQAYASLGSHLTVPKTTKKVIQKAEKQDPAAQLRDRYARMGLNIHTTAIARFLEANRQVGIEREEYANKTEETLRRNTRLYNNIAYPLAATILTSADGHRGSFAVRIARLRQDIAAAKEEITRLNDEANECRRIEAEAWKEFKGSFQEGRAASDVDREAKVAAEEFKEEARGIVRDKYRLLEEIDADFKGKIQEETQRMMMDLLSGI